MNTLKSKIDDLKIKNGWPFCYVDINLMTPSGVTLNVKIAYSYKSLYPTFHTISYIVVHCLSS
jgi:hypothetical protein